jgi:hypothetical protein
MPSEDELRALLESRRTWNGKPLSDDPRNVYQRDWYRRKHPRKCVNCGAEIGRWQRRCPRCDIIHQADLREARNDRRRQAL